MSSTTPPSTSPTNEVIMNNNGSSESKSESMEITNNSNQAPITHPVIIAPIDMANLPASILEQLQKSHIVTLPTSPLSPHPPLIAPAIGAGAASRSNSITATDNNMNSMDTSSATPPPNNANTQKTKKNSLTPDERRQRRLLRNRLAAKECRKKKKNHIQDMEETIKSLNQHNEELRKQVQELKDKLTFPNISNMDENYKLMKEVEELNAKLGMK